MRDFLLRASVLLGVITALLTELLGQFHLLRRGPVALAWTLIAAAAVLFLYRHPPPLPRLVIRPLETVICAVIAAIVAVVAVTAWLSAPNSYDALAYHMPRVLYWAQSGSVAFFPTSYFTQISLQPLSEYFMLHTYLLSGGDRFVNLVTTAAFVLSIAGVSSIAEAFGLGTKAQAWTALFCATLPNAILQASGPKNDTLLELWLVCLVYFAARQNAPFAGLAFGLALATKGTAYLFAPPLIAGVLACHHLDRLRCPRDAGTWDSVACHRPDRPGGLSHKLLRLAVCLLAGALLLNTPQYLRNLQFSGSPMGPASPYATGLYRWKNDRFGWKPTVSNTLRNLSDQLGGRSARWNQAVYNVSISLHRALHIDPQDPATTWQPTLYGPPVSTAHEGSANNRWHLLLLIAAATLAAWSAWKRHDARWLIYTGSLLVAYLLFCFYLKWEPSGARFQLPLFIVASPLAGFLLAEIRPIFIPILLGVFLLSGARLPLLKNWTRPLLGPQSLFAISRDESYFSDMLPLHDREAYLEAVDRTARSGCLTVGIDSSSDQPEYVFEALLRERKPAVRFLHTGVENASSRYYPATPPRPCAVLCLDATGSRQKIARYGAISPPIPLGRFLLFLFLPPNP